ncbi:MAG: TetR/AcrR family transcriptional regulator [Bdellovibrionales bacterium]|nr:TetR/AcrR family transcriptional regulator [Bdellovibrionales bacterium]
MCKQEILHSKLQIKLTSKQIYLLETYLQLAAKIGVEEVTLKKLAAKANVALGTVHYHFSGKNLGLVDMAMRYVDQESVRFINYQLDKNASSSNFKGIDDYIMTLFDWAKQFPHHSQFYLFFYYHSSVHRQYAELNKKYIQLMKKRITELLQVKSIKNTESLAEEIHSQVYGTLILCSIDSRPNRIEYYQSLAIRSANHLVNFHQQN